MKNIIAALLIAAVSGLPSFAVAQDPIANSGSNRVRARLNPIINVDASGHAELERAAGTANDRFTSEVEIAKDDFDALGITPGNGFADEVVELRVIRNGTRIFSIMLQFSENRPTDITFESDTRGAAAPEVRAGDIGRVIINGTATLRGQFRLR